MIGDAYKKTDQFLTVFRNFMSLILMGIAGLSVLNTMVRIVKERTREVGTWRSLGYTNRQLSAIFSVEALILGIVGSSLGAFL